MPIKRRYQQRRVWGILIWCLEILSCYKLYRWLRKKVWPKTAERARIFASGELREVSELIAKQESFRQFISDSRQLLYDFFIPHHGNDHRPHALRSRSLLAYAILALGMKVALSTTLFLYYPTPARLARIISKDIVTLTNRSRAEAGLPPLRVDPTLEAAARRKGEDMMARDYFAHDGPDGRRPWSWIDRQLYDYVYAGENLAVDFLSADTIHEAFIKSPSHRANVLHNRYEDIGVAVVSGELGGRETELLVQFFGTRRSTSRTIASAPIRPARVPAPQPSVTPSTVPPATTAATPTPTPSPPTLTASPLPELAPPRIVAQPPELDRAELAAPPEPEVLALPSEPILVLGATSKSGQIVEALLAFSNFFFVAMLIFLSIALVLNIFIRVRVQHPDLILQTIAVLSLLLALLLTKWHFVERLGRELRILGG